MTRLAWSPVDGSRFATKAWGVLPRSRSRTQWSGLAAGGAGLAYSAAVLATTGLVSYWRLNEPSGTSAADSKGTNTGTYVGTPTLGAASNLTDGSTAVTFSGATGQYVRVTHNASLVLNTTLTLEAWVNPTDRANFYWIVSKNLNAFPASYEWRLENTTGLSNLLIGNSGASSPNLATAAPPTGSWSHLAVSIDASGNFVHYLNGATNGSGTNAAARADGANDLLIGGRADLSVAGFKGTLDEIAVYNVVVPGATITSHFNSR